MKRLFHGSLSILCACLLSACTHAAPATGTGDSPSGTGGVVTLRVLAHDTLLMDMEIAAFQQTHPNIRVVSVVPSGGYRNMIATGDIDVFPVAVVADLVQDGQLTALDPLIQRDALDLKGYGTSLDSLRWKGTLYELPAAVQPQVMIFNLDLFASAGVAVPKEGWTWDQFRTLAAKLTRGEGDQKIWGFATERPEDLGMIQLAQRNGNGALATTADMKDVLQFLNALVADKIMPPVAPQDYTTGGPWTSSASPFETGRAAIGLSSLSALRNKRQEPYRWAIGPLPDRSNGTGANLAQQVVTYGMRAGSKHPAEAWQFLQFLAGPQGAEMAAKVGVLPAIQSDGVKAAWLERPNAPPGSEVLLSKAWIPDPSARNARSPADTQRYLAQENAFNQVAAGKKAWEQALAVYLSDR